MSVQKRLVQPNLAVQNPSQDQSGQATKSSHQYLPDDFPLIPKNNSPAFTWKMNHVLRDPVNG
ncbi:hypothetical protein T06_2929 [Trichinella sp. T6]|nr:hypothetical protein T06_2929 [Trichinella sp. T6]